MVGAGINSAFSSLHELAEADAILTAGGLESIVGLVHAMDRVMILETCNIDC